MAQVRKKTPICTGNTKLTLHLYLFQMQKHLFHWQIILQTDSMEISLIFTTLFAVHRQMLHVFLQELNSPHIYRIQTFTFITIFKLM